jgi:hypothetical protein
MVEWQFHFMVKSAFSQRTSTYSRQHSTAFRYLSALLHRLAIACGYLQVTHSWSTRHGLSPLVTRAFLVASAKLWNELPGDFTAAQSLTAFRQQLKTRLFRHSYPEFN